MMTLNVHQLAAGKRLKSQTLNAHHSGVGCYDMLVSLAVGILEEGYSYEHRTLLDGSRGLDFFDVGLECPVLNIIFYGHRLNIQDILLN
jgi:hypothetical protein